MERESSPALNGTITGPEVEPHRLHQRGKREPRSPHCSWCVSPLSCSPLSSKILLLYRSCSLGERGDGRKEEDSAHPRLTARNSPHLPPKGILSFRAIPWPQPGCEASSSEPAPWHRSWGCAHRHGQSSSYTTRESWNTEPSLCSARELILHGSRIRGGGGGGRFLGRCTNTGAALCKKSLPTRPCARSAPREGEKS